jgi:N-acetylmuramoyl-L-alanine amidase
VVRKENNVVIKNEYSSGKLVLLCLPVCVTFLVPFLVTQYRPSTESSIQVESVAEVPQNIEKVNIEDCSTPTTATDLDEEDLAYQIEFEDYMGELELLANLVEAESGNQDLKGKRLVADVVLNRVESDRFPNTITEVIYQDYQFSTVLDGALERASWHISDESFEAVRLEALESEERLDEDILFFTYGEYNKHCEPAYQYGSHYFGY